MPALIQAFLDEASSTYTYVVHEADDGPCAIVDSVLNYDPASGRTDTRQADKVIAYVREHRLQVQWLLETHAHADHLSAAPYLRRTLGGKIAIGQAISKVQHVFKHLFNLEPEFRVDGSQFDHLFAPDEIFPIGNLKAQALHVPGHTPADMAYLIDDQLILVGDTLFMPDVAPPAATSPVAMHTSCMRRCASSWPSRRRRDCTYATTTRHKAVRPGARPPWPSSARAISMCMTGWMKRRLCRCGPSAMPGWGCRHCCCRRSR